MKECNCGSCLSKPAAVAMETAGTGGCACGHDRDQEHSHGHNHAQPALTESCGCGCGQGQDQKNELSGVRQDVIAVLIAAALLGVSFLLPKGWSDWASYAVLGTGVLVAGWPIFLQGVKNLARLRFNELSLMTVAVVAAACIGELREALLVTALFRLGEILEDLAVSRSRREVEAITEIIPENANLLRADGGTELVSARGLAPGDRILVKAGERFPVDCRVVEGDSSVDLSSLTGESLPRNVSPGDEVLSSAINSGGVLVCEAVSRFEDSAATKIIEMVRESSAKKGRTEKLISRFAAVYTPIVMLLAALTALLPPLLGFGAFSTWIYRALIFLVASCPCALVIATPLAFFAGIGASSRQGVLIKGSRYVEALARAETVVFDKTGTLTTGRLTVSGVIPAEGVDPDEVLRLAALCEGYSNHPIAQAVVAAWGERDRGRGRHEVSACEELAARGMRAVVDGAQLLCGSARMMEENGVDISALPEANLYLARDGAALGAVQVRDLARPDAAEAVRALAAMGVTRTVMLTGDGPEAAAQVQRETGVGEVCHSLLPDGKVREFERIKAQTRGSAVYVGDGINDSPVLARSDVGVAMGLASDAAMQAADVVLLSDGLHSLPGAIRTARRTSRLARGIIAFALTVKLGVLILAFFGAANMLLAVFADVGVTVISVLLATMALRFR